MMRQDLFHFDGVQPFNVCSADTATITSANGMAKDVFGKLKDVLPASGLKFTNDVKFDSSRKLGEQLSEVVWLTLEHGFTYNGTGGSKVTLNAPDVAESKEANILGNEIIFRTEIVYKLLKQTVDAGDKAFKAYWSQALVNVKKSFNKRLEIEMIHGQSSLGTLTSATDAGTSSVLTITAATWAPSVWVGMKNARIDLYNSTTKINTRADVQITKVDIKNRQLTVTGNSLDIDDLIAVGTSGSGAKIYFKGQYGNNGMGLKDIAAMTSGSYLGIAGSSYPDLWNGTQVTVSGALDWDKIQDGLEEAAGRGREIPLKLLVSNASWSNLNSDLAALRAIDSSYSEKETSMGTKSITFYSATGTVEVVPTGYMMGGDAIAYPSPGEADIARIGVSDITFDPSGKDGSEGMFRHTENSNTVELRAWSDQSLYTTNVRDTVYYSSITN